MKAYIYFNEMIHEFMKSEKGVTSIEYGILAAGLAIVISTVLGDDGAFTKALRGTFDGISTQLKENTGGGASGN